MVVLGCTDNHIFGWVDLWQAYEFVDRVYLMTPEQTSRVIEDALCLTCAQDILDVLPPLIASQLSEADIENLGRFIIRDRKRKYHDGAADKQYDMLNEVRVDTKKVRIQTLKDAIAKLNEQEVAKPFTEIARHSDWRSMARLARKEQHNADIAHLCVMIQREEREDV